MSTPGLSDADLTVIGYADEVVLSGDCALGLIRTIANEITAKGDEDEPFEPSHAWFWGRHLTWIIDMLGKDIMKLEKALRDAGRARRCE